MSAAKNTKMNQTIVTSDPPSRAVGKDGSYYECIVCDTEGELLCCETCPNTFHIGCLTPALKSVPKGDWYCTSCCLKTAVKTPRRRLRKKATLKKDAPAGELHPSDEALFDDQEQNDANLNGDAKDSKTTSDGNGLKVYTRRPRSKK